MRRILDGSFLPGDVSPHVISRLIQALSIIGVVFIYALISANSLVALFYIPLAVFAGAWFFPLVCLMGIVVVSAVRWVPGTLTEAFLAGQAMVVVVLLFSRGLVASRRPAGMPGWFLARAGGLLRFVFAAFAVVLLIRMALFRVTTAVEDGAWAITLLAFVWQAPWPAPRHTGTWKAALLNVALALFSSTLGLVALELVARALYVCPVNGPLAHGGYEFHPQCLFTLKAGWTDTYPRPPGDDKPGTFEVTISSQGLRARELGPKQPDEFRILALGDSFTMGWGLSYEETYTHMLEELLNARRPAKRVTVINAGVSGYGPWQERVFFIERGLPLEPDLVLLQVYPENDVGNTLTKVGKHLKAYNLDWEDRLLFWRSEKEWYTRAEWWLMTHCRLYYVYRLAAGPDRSVSRLLRDLRFTPQGRNDRLGPNAPRPCYLEVMLDAWYPDLQEGWDLMTQDIAAIREDCVQRGIGFLAFSLPMMQEMDDESWGSSVASAEGPVTYERFKDVRVCEQFFRDAHIPYVSVKDALLARSASGKIYFNEGHLNAAGDRALAETLSEYLIEQVLPTYGILPAFP